MNKFRTIKDPEVLKKNESMAVKVIKEVISIFLFRLKVQEPVPEYVWFDRSVPVNLNLMGGSFDEHEVGSLQVDVCYFPMVGYKTGNNCWQVIYPAQIIPCEAPKKKFLGII